MSSLTYASLALTLASTALAYGPGGDYGGYSGGSNPYTSGNNGGNSNSNSYSQYSEFASKASQGQKILLAHAVLAALAFVIFFPAGGILIRLGSFRGLWLVHGILQIFAYVLYIVAFGLGIWMATNLRMLNQAHPIIGIVLFVVLFFQPVLGFAHHLMFKKHSRRVVWSYGHIWLGRIIITLGIINGGLGLQLAKRTRLGAPSNGQVVAYSVVAAIMWVAYMICAVVGEIKRHRARKNGVPPKYIEKDPDAQGVRATGGTYA